MAENTVKTPASYGTQQSGSGFDEIECSDDGMDGVHGERALWRAVITQALMDAGRNPSNTAEKVERARAIAWLAGKSKDFETVCSFAGLDPNYVICKAREAIKRNCKWRNVNPNKKAPPRLKKKNEQGASPATGNIHYLKTAKS